MALEHFLNGPNRADLKNGENTEIPGNIGKNGRLRPSKYQNSVIFQDMRLTFCTHTHPTYFHIIHVLHFRIFRKLENYH